MGLSRSLLLLITLSQFLQQHSCFRTGIVPRSTTKLHSATIQEKCNVHVYETCSEVGNALCSEFIEIGQTAIEEKGSFFVAVPGGSVLKLLAGLTERKDELDWSKVTLFYINHKCVGESDKTATHYKAKKLFADELGLENVLYITNDEVAGACGHNTIAHNYEQKMRNCGLPVDYQTGFPIVDYMVLGMSKDGCIGSLYSGRKDVEKTDSWVIPINKKSPASISLSLPVMNGSRHIRVVLMGSDKSEAIMKAMKHKAIDHTTFPAAALARKAEWMIDKPCASHLLTTKNDDYFLSREW